MDRFCTISVSLVLNANEVHSSKNKCKVKGLVEKKAVQYIK